MDCSPPGFSDKGISQARILEWVAISFSKGSSPPRDWIHISCISCIGKQILYHWATKKGLRNGTAESICHKENWVLKNWCLWVVMLEKNLESPLDVRRSNQSILIFTGNWPWIFMGRTDAEVETLIICPPDAKNRLIGKDPDSGKDWRQEKKGVTGDEMAGWHHWLNRHESEQILENSEGQGGLVCCSPQGHKE